RELVHPPKEPREDRLSPRPPGRAAGPADRTPLALQPHGDPRARFQQLAGAERQLRTPRRGGRAVSAAADGQAGMDTFRRAIAETEVAFTAVQQHGAGAEERASAVVEALVSHLKSG